MKGGAHGERKKKGQTSLREIQENEFEALKSIWLDDFVELNEGWRRKTNVPAHFKIHLTPFTNMEQENHVAVFLEVTFGSMYPQKEPTLKIEKDKGLSDTHLKELRKIVLSRAASLVGSEMIHELTSTVQEYLVANNRPQHMSFHQQMVERQRHDNEEQERKLEEEMAKQSEERKVAQAELTRLIEKEKRRKQKEIRKQRDKRNFDGLDLWTPNIDTVSDEEGADQEDKEDKEDSDPKPVRPSKTVAPVQPAAQEPKPQSTKPAVEVVKLVSKKEASEDGSEEEDDKEDAKPNPSAAKIDKKKKKKKNKKKRKDKGEEHPSPKLEPRVSVDILPTRTLGAAVTATLALPTTAAPMAAAAAVPAPAPVVATLKPPPISIPPPTPKIDPEEKSIGPSLLDDLPDDLDASQRAALEDFLDQHHRPFDYEGAVANLEAEMNEEGDEPPVVGSASPSISPYVPAARGPPIAEFRLDAKPQVQTSRFRSDFEDLGHLGKGGFGEVVRARNKIDGLVYAIKKIKMRNNRPDVNKKIVREVSTIAMLHHRYIVRYFQAWVEGGPDLDALMESESDEEQDWLNPRSNMSFTQSDDRQERAARKRGKSKPDKSAQFLYIQMEFCPNKTLRDLIDEKLSERPEAVWRLFRQLLEAVSFIHSKNIMHRDIKPPNVFIDSQGNIKLGDFGLAITSVASGNDEEANEEEKISKGSDASKSKEKREDDPLNPLSAHSTITEVVGTPFYRSPEQEAVGVEYDSKADMWALGIIFFEMWRPFATLMERVNQLTELRKTGKVPADFDCKEDTEHVKEIIEWLMKRDAKDRPTADTLLRSGLIPLKVEDEYMELALKSVANRDSDYHSRLMEMLFSDNDDLVDYTYDYVAATRQSNPTTGVPHHVKNQLQMQTFDRLVKIFRAHGASHFETPLLTPRTSKTMERNSAAFIDPSGTVIELPHTLTIPFARFLAQRSIQTSDAVESFGGDWQGTTFVAGTRAGGLALDLRRYDISKVYRKNAVGRPKEFYECDFDIAWANHEHEAGVETKGSKNRQQQTKENAKAREKSVVLTAEVIKILDEILLDFSFSTAPGPGQYIIRINHLNIFDAVLDRVLDVHFANATAPSASPQTTPSSSTSTSVMSTIAPSMSMSSATPKAVKTKRAKNRMVRNESSEADEREQLRQHICLLLGQRLPGSGGDGEGGGCGWSVPLWNKSKLRKHLLHEKHMNEKSLDMLGRALCLQAEFNTDKFENLFKRLTYELITSSAKHSSRTGRSPALVLDALESIKLILAHAHNFSVNARILFDVGLVGNYDLYHSGIVFQAVTSTPGQGTPKSPSQNTYDVIAVGGRYDSTIARFTPPNCSDSTPLCAVGVNIAIEKLVASAISNEFLSQNAKRKPIMRGKRLGGRQLLMNVAGAAPEAVLLYASGNAMLRLRARTAVHLWADDIRAEYMHPVGLRLGSIRQYCEELGIRWLVIFRRTAFQTNESGGDSKTELELEAKAGKKSPHPPKKSADDGELGSGMVQVNDMAFSAGGVTTGGEPVEGAWKIMLTDLPDFLRSRIGTRTTKKQAPGADPFSTGSAPTNKKSTDLDVKMIDPDMKIRTFQKSKLMQQIGRALGPLLQDRSSVHVLLAIDLPIMDIRDLTNAFYRDLMSGNATSDGSSKKKNTTTQIQNVLSAYSTHSREYLLLEALAAELRRCASVHNGPRIIFVYSIPDQKPDVISVGIG